MDSPDPGPPKRHYRTDALDATGALAKALAAVLPNRLLIGLVGTLGAGKTTFTKQLAAGLGVDPNDVTSPTFVICQAYRGRVTLNHVDAYRIADEDEWYELGLDEMIDDDAVTVIEWSDRFQHLLPADRLDIVIDHVGEQSRQFTLVPQGDAARTVVDRLLFDATE